MPHSTPDMTFFYVIAAVLIAIPVFVHFGIRKMPKRQRGLAHAFSLLAVVVLALVLFTIISGLHWSSVTEFGGVAFCAILLVAVSFIPTMMFDA